MAFSKVILNGDTLMDVTQDTVAANNLLSGETATGANGLRVSGAVTVPTKTSDLTNDGEGTSPFASEAYVNSAVPSTYVSSFNGSSGAVTYTAPVTSVNTKTGAVSLTASDVGALPSSTAIPTKTSDLTNDSNFVADVSYVHTDNNYTSTEKTKLSGIATGAEVNVQSDWNVTSSSSDAFIKNKPTIPSKVSDLTNDSNFITAAQAPVQSVNGQTGVVVLDASDVGALPDSTVIPPEVTESTVAGWGFTKNTGTYSKPSGGIPSTDLAAAVQTSLGKADTALQSAPVTSVNSKTGAVVLSASDVGAYTIPSGGIPSTDLSSAVQTSLGKADTALQTAPVTSVNGQTGAVSISIPTATSDLTNDSGFITESDADGAYTQYTEVSSMSGLITALASVPNGTPMVLSLTQGFANSLCDSTHSQVNGSGIFKQPNADRIDYEMFTAYDHAFGNIDLTNQNAVSFQSYRQANWFDLGTKITSGDLDNYQTAGRYFCEASDAPNIAHKPTSSAFALYVAYIYNQWRPFQLAFDFDARFYVRVLTGNGWTDWTTSYPLLNATTQTTAGVYALDAAVGKVLADAISALTTAVQSKESLVGDTAIPSAANLNSYTTLGTFYASSNNIASSLSNCPFTVACKLVVEGGTSSSNVPGHLRQTVTPYNAQDIYIRTSINSGSTWSAWKKVTLTNA